MPSTAGLDRSLNDGTITRRLTRATARARTAIERQPDLRRLQHLLTSPAPHAAEMERRLRPLLQDVRWIRPLLVDLSDLIAAEPLLELPLIATAAGPERAVVIGSSAQATVSLVLRNVAPVPPSVRVGGQVVLHRLLSGSAAVQRWRGSPIDDAFTLHDAPRLIAGRWHALRADRIVREDGRRDGMLWRVDRPAVLLRAAIHSGRSCYARVHDDQGMIMGASAIDDGASRLAMLATMLTSMARADALPAIGRLLEARDFSLRWLAARLIGMLDDDAGRASLLRLEGDPHPEVREAAHRGLLSNSGAA
ncbi:hypothetical protein GGR88_000444 [Sphingomonas jejuensis]|uniref:HEAT repeat domain-containing protein n=1 Tax=Sphingomonas jejuensis TaxID=904715 RepID=A0ABX0XIB5_9SPHN|nr:hypothetical protein [Sphingomonas jejuensis]NJC32970.1 hypothetical protein [Sphingomonas jejuensis]